MLMTVGSSTAVGRMCGLTPTRLKMRMMSLSKPCAGIMKSRLVPVEPKSARELGMAVRAGEGRQASLQQFLECAQTVLAELEPK